MKLPSSIKNWVSISGAALALFNLASILSLVILSTFFNFGGSYIGLFIYIVLPIFMIAGLFLGIATAAYGVYQMLLPLLGNRRNKENS